MGREGDAAHADFGIFGDDVRGLAEARRDWPGGSHKVKAGQRTHKPMFSGDREVTTGATTTPVICVAPVRSRCNPCFCCSAAWPVSLSVAGANRVALLLLSLGHRSRAQHER